MRAGRSSSTAAGAAVAGALLTAAAAAGAAPLPGAPDCQILPQDNVWNQRVDGLPRHPRSNVLITTIGRGENLHPDFSDRGRFGIPVNVVGAATNRSQVGFDFAGESDRVPHPIPPRPRIERGSDRHMLMLDHDACWLYELFNARRTNGRWRAGSGAVFDLDSNRLRPRGHTSADAAGLPILPGLVRFDEVRRGEIDHALRFTAPRTRTSFIYPARHQAGSGSSGRLPPMGLRVRLKRSVSLRGHGRQARVILTALKRYGMILADNGSPWFVTGAPSPGWDDDGLRSLRRLTGTDFEVVDTSRLRSGQPPGERS